MCGEPGIEAGDHALLVGRAQMLVGKDLKAWLQRRLAAFEPSDLRALPHDAAVGRERDGVVRGGGERLGAGGQLRRQHLRGSMARGLAVNAVARRIRRELEAVQAADIMVLDQNLTVGADLGHHLLLIAQAPHEYAGAPVDKTLCQAVMKGVGQGVLYRTGAVLPMLRVVEPLGAMGHVGPGADLGEPVRQRVEVAVGAVGLCDLVGKPIFGNLALVAHDEAEQGGDELRVARRRHLAVVWDLAHLP